MTFVPAELYCGISTTVWSYQHELLLTGQKAWFPAGLMPRSAGFTCDRARAHTYLNTPHMRVNCGPTPAWVLPGAQAV